MRLIEDHDGAPLPDEVQFESPAWLLVYGLKRERGGTSIECIEAADAAMIAIAPLLLPFD